MRLTADHEVHAALQADVVDELRRELAAARRETLALQSTAMELAAMALRYRRDPKHPGRWLTAPLDFQALVGPSLDQVNALLAPHKLGFRQIDAEATA